jgi:hypothetical protein
MKQKQVTLTCKGPGWTISVTGSPAFAKQMIKKYVPKVQAIVRECNLGHLPVGGAK